jgi:Ca-activated chloride channel homolog
MTHLALRQNLLALLLFTPLAAQSAVPDELSARQWIAPTARAQAFGAQPTVAVTGLEARVRIDGAVAHTRLRIALANPADRPAEAELLLPVPRGAVIDGFDFQGTGTAPSARLLAVDEARRTYDGIVSRLRDPALLEFAGSALLRSSVFPVPAQGTQMISLDYHEVLPADGERVDYELLRTAGLGATVPLVLELEVAGDPSAVFSPTHRLRLSSQDERSVSYRVDSSDLESGSFRCAVLRGVGPGGSIFACPDEDGIGGTFLLFAGVGRLASQGANQGSILAREVTVVLDRSGSMAGPKFEQARTAALQVLEGLRPGERFRIVDYSDRAAASAAVAVEKTPASIAAARAYLAAIDTGGGTNIAAALSEALAPEAAPGTVPVVLFLTDGRPTVGVQTEAELAALVAGANGQGRRIFTFGVGDDVNAPLLDRLALGSRATSSYVRPEEDVERVVGGLFRRLSGPVMAGLDVRILGADGAADTTLVRDLLPRQLPDLFAGEELVLLGRYTEARPLVVEIRAQSGAGPLRLTADLAKASPRNEFVPRLWATRRIGELTDAIRQATGGSVAPEALLADERTRELADEILRLSLRHGVLSEFTAFLSLQGSTLAGWDQLAEMARRNLVVENARERSGAGAVNFARNNVAMQQTSYPNNSNVLWTKDDRRVPILSVQPAAQGALYQSGNEWIEGRLLESLGGNALPEPDEVVVIGSPEYGRLIDELAADGRSAVAAQEPNALYRHRGRIVRQVPAPMTAPMPVTPPTTALSNGEPRR